MKRSFILIAAIILLSANAYALDPSGKYSYKEKGYSGEMTVTQTKTFPITWHVNVSTVSPAPQFHTCDVEATGESLISSEKEIEALFVSKVDGGDTPAKFTIKFTSKGALIEVQESGGTCGLNGYYGGKWVKTVAKKGKKK